MLKEEALEPSIQKEKNVSDFYRKDPRTGKMILVRTPKSRKPEESPKVRAKAPQYIPKGRTTSPEKPSGFGGMTKPEDVLKGRIKTPEETRFKPTGTPEEIPMAAITNPLEMLGISEKEAKLLFKNMNMNDMRILFEQTKKVDNPMISTFVFSQMLEGMFEQVEETQAEKEIDIDKIADVVSKKVLDEIKDLPWLTKPQVKKSPPKEKVKKEETSEIESELDNLRKNENENRESESS